MKICLICCEFGNVPQNKWSFFRSKKLYGKTFQNPILTISRAFNIFKRNNFIITGRDLTAPLFNRPAIYPQSAVGYWCMVEDKYLSSIIHAIIMIIPDTKNAYVRLQEFLKIKINI